MPSEVCRQNRVMASLLDWIRNQPRGIQLKLLGSGIAVATLFGVLFSQLYVSEKAGQEQNQQSIEAQTFDVILDNPTESLHVHVVGEIVQPGLYQLDFGSRVSDAIAAAGGFSPNALQTSVNLARQLSDGEQVVVLSVVADSGEQQSDLVSINRATAAELDSLPGIGPALAERIIKHRTETGGFSSVSQLQEVSGIGEKVFAEIEPLVTL